MTPAAISSCRQWCSLAGWPQRGDQCEIVCPLHGWFVICFRWLSLDVITGQSRVCHGALFDSAFIDDSASVNSFQLPPCHVNYRKYLEVNESLRVFTLRRAHGSTHQSKDLCVGIQRHTEYTVKQPSEREFDGDGRPWMKLFGGVCTTFLTCAFCSQ